MNSIKDKEIEPYFINLENGYVLHKTVQSSESNKTYERFVGHYRNLDSCIKAIAKDKMMEKSHDSLKGFISEYQQVVNSLNEVLC
jgi:Tfp pilus assembly protein PilF